MNLTCAIKSISRNVALFIISDSFYFGGYGILSAFFSILITTKITNGALNMIGYALSLELIARAITEIPISLITTRLSTENKRIIITMGQVAYGFTILLLGQATSMQQVFAYIMFLGVIDATVYPLRWAFFSKIISEDNAEMEWCLQDVSATVLPAITTALAGLISGIWGLDAVFIFSGFLFLLGGATFNAIRPEERDEMTIEKI